MTIVITMAGLGSRFKQAGFDRPKYEIRAKNKTLFEWSLMSLRPVLGPKTKVIFVTLKEHKPEEFISQACAGMNIQNCVTIAIDALTDGQATTARLALPACQPDEPLLVFNIDTHIHPDAWTKSMIPARADGWSLCFDAPGSHWSFASVGPDGWATAFAEKKKISDHATTGLYYFRNAATFDFAYRQTYESENIASVPERYIAPMYDVMIRRGLKVGVSDIPFTAVVPLGTPDELKAFLQRDS